MISRRGFIISAFSIVPFLCCQGCLGTAEPASANVFDEMLACDVATFARLLGAEYISEKFMLDDGFKVFCYEGSVCIQWEFFRYFDDSLAPNKLVLSKRIFTPISDTNVLSAKFREVYIKKTSTLKTGDADYWKLDPEGVYDSIHLENNNYVSISFEDARFELEQAGDVELLSHTMSGVSEHFVELFLDNMRSSFNSHDWGSFSDYRK